jgi:hypothetical protein
MFKSHALKSHFRLHPTALKIPRIEKEQKNAEGWKKTYGLYFDLCPYIDLSSVLKTRQAHGQRIDGDIHSLKDITVAVRNVLILPDVVFQNEAVFPYIVEYVKGFRLFPKCGF